MKKLFFLASLVSLACISCKSKKEAAKSPENTATAVSNTTDAPVTYRLIISFISKGAGTDSEKRTAILAYVRSHPKKPAYKTVIWGREGEADYCFNLSEFSSQKELVAFIEDIKKIIANSDMVTIAENAECQHKGR
jgi:hypothetical protein